MVNLWRHGGVEIRSRASVDTFVDHYHHHHHHHRLHRSLPHHATPATAYRTRPKATPGHDRPDNEYRVSHDRVDSGAVTLRHHGHLFHIGIGRQHNGTPIVMLIHDLGIRIIHAATGEILRHLTLDTTHTTYQPTGAKRGGPSRPYGPRKRKKPEP